jgi:hypothetical protein
MHIHVVNGGGHAAESLTPDHPFLVHRGSCRGGSVISSVLVDSRPGGYARIPDIFTHIFFFSLAGYEVAAKRPRLEGDTSHCYWAASNFKQGANSATVWELIAECACVGGYLEGPIGLVLA